MVDLGIFSGPSWPKGITTFSVRHRSQPHVFPGWYTWALWDIFQKKNLKNSSKTLQVSVNPSGWALDKLRSLIYPFFIWAFYSQMIIVGNWIVISFGRTVNKLLQRCRKYVLLFIMSSEHLRSCKDSLKWGGFLKRETKWEFEKDTFRPSLESIS